MKHHVVRLLCLVPFALIFLYFVLSSNSFTGVSSSSSLTKGVLHTPHPTEQDFPSRSPKKGAKKTKKPVEAVKAVEEIPSTKPQPTEADSQCKNGGALFQGACKCPIGWSGETCENDLAAEGGPWAPEFHIKNTFYDEQLPPAFLKAFGSDSVKSVLDVGCGLGLYLKGLWELGVSTCVGIEPSNMAKDPRSPFHSSVCSLLQLDAFDPKKGEVDLGEKFELLLSFEVAEHVPRERHTKYFDFITRHAEKAIIFSAAGLGQTGHGHISNRPPCEWIEEFRKRGWYLDPDASWTLRQTSRFIWFRDNLCIFRKHIPHDPEILKKILELAVPHFYDSLPVTSYSFPVFPDWKEMQDLDKSTILKQWNQSVETEVLRRQREAELQAARQKEEQAEKEKAAAQAEKEKAATKAVDDDEEEQDDDDDDEEETTQKPTKKLKSKKRKSKTNK